VQGEAFELVVGKRHGINSRSSRQDTPTMTYASSRAWRICAARDPAIQVSWRGARCPLEKAKASATEPGGILAQGCAVL